MKSYAERMAIRAKHQVKHHDERGLMWSSCSCGWQSRKLDSYYNYQVTESRMAGAQHVARSTNGGELIPTTT
jgi:hypothetical protein